MDEPPGGTDATPADQRVAAKAEIDAAVTAVRTGQAQQLEDLPPSYSDLVVKDLDQDIVLKRAYAYILLGILVAQLLIADAVFVAYAHFGVGWDIPPEVIDGWLVATLIEIVGIVLVVTRYLFPRRDQQA